MSQPSWSKTGAQTQAPLPLRILGVALLASIIAGLTAGVGARIVMRVIALTITLPTQFSWEGTGNVVVVGTAFGVLAGLIYALAVAAVAESPRSRRYVPGSLVRGPLFGILILAILGPFTLSQPLKLPEEDIIHGVASQGIPYLNNVLFGSLPLIFGIVLGSAERILDRYLPGHLA